MAILANSTVGKETPPSTGTSQIEKKSLNETLHPIASAFNITLLNSSGNLREYISRLENAYERLQKLKLSHVTRRIGGRPPHDLAQQSQSFDRVGSLSADNVFPEDQVSFLFLKNLGPEYKRWVDTLCMTSNIGGFGSGPKLAFKDITRRAVEAEAMGQLSRG